MFLNNYPTMLPVAGFKPSILIKVAVCYTTVLLGLNCTLDELDFLEKKKKLIILSKCGEVIMQLATKRQIGQGILNEREEPLQLISSY